MTDRDKIVEIMALGRYTRHEDVTIEDFAKLSEKLQEQWMRGDRAALEALEEAGYAVVPKEPTLRMVTEMWKAQGDPKDGICFGMDRAYQAMLTAAQGDEG